MSPFPRTRFLTPILPKELVPDPYSSLRHEALDREQPIPPGLQETLTAAAECGLRLEQDPAAGCTLVIGLTGVHTKTFQTALRRSYQHRFRYAA